MQRQVAAADQDLSQAQNELWNVKRRISEVETALVSPSTRHPERVDYLLEMKDLMQQRSELERRVAQAERRLAAAEAELTDYRAFLADASPNGVVRPIQASY
jgi:predicted  nucleic acid-binding Zn-ribbon protein